MKIRNIDLSGYWKVLLPAVAFALLYLPVILGLIHDWNDDPNYAHGYFIPFISLYLLWKYVPKLKNVTPKRSMTGAVVLLGGIVFYLLGAVGHSITLTRLTLMVVIPGVVLYTLGWAYIRKIWFPIAYLAFMIPLPDILYNAISLPLKSLVTEVSVETLNLMGISVYREGNVILLPNIVLEVADACSGIRSLISLISLSVLIAWFTQNRLITRITVVLSAIPVSVFANSIRVIITGILVSVVGKSAAEGFFHEFAGLAIFLCSMVLVLGIARLVKRFDNPDASTAPAIKDNVEEGALSATRTGLANRIISASVLMFLAAVPATLIWRYEAPLPQLRPLAEFNRDIGKWIMASEIQLDAATLALLKPDDYLLREYKTKDNTITLYIGFHNSRKSSGRIHSPKHCLPSSGWTKIVENEKSFGKTNQYPDSGYMEAVYEKDMQKVVFSYWYQVGARHIIQDHSLGIAGIREVLAGRSSFTAFVRISTPAAGTNIEGASRTNEEFMKSLLPLLNTYIKGV